MGAKKTCTTGNENTHGSKRLGGVFKLPCTSLRAQPVQGQARAGQQNWHASRLPKKTYFRRYLFHGKSTQLLFSLIAGQ
jgi:hypothetical protein